MQIRVAIVGVRRGNSMSVLFAERTGANEWVRQRQEYTVNLDLRGRGRCQRLMMSVTWVNNNECRAVRRLLDRYLDMLGSYNSIVFHSLTSSSYFGARTLVPQRPWDVNLR